MARSRIATSTSGCSTPRTRFPSSSGSSIHAPGRRSRLQRGVALEPGLFAVLPDGAAADHAALVEALRGAELLGVARWAMRGKRYFETLEARDSHLALIAMRTADKVVSAAQLELPSGSPVRDAERASVCVNTPWRRSSTSYRITWPSIARTRGGGSRCEGSYWMCFRFLS